MADIAKVEHKVMGLNDNKTGEQSNGLKVEAAIFILLIIGAIVIIGFWLGVGWPDELPNNFSNLLTVEAVKEYLDYKERLRAARLQFLTSIAASLGAIGVVFNLYYTGKREEAFNKSAEAALENAKAAQDKQITERFTKAVEQLASQEIAVRLGGIYALERIAKDSKKDHWTIMEVLTAFVREPPPLKAALEEEKPLLELPPYIQKAKDDKQPQKLRIDIQAALTVIGRRDTAKDLENQKLDLRNTDIAGANLSKANLQGANFYQANLQGANLHGVNLEGAKLDEANLQWAKLCNAKLQKARLPRANLGHASLNWAELQGAILNWAELQGTILDYARLEMAYLCYVNLQEARLSNTKLEGAILREANLEGATLNGAVLKGVFLNGANMKETSLYVANLEGANLKDAKNLKLEQIKTAFRDSDTILPDDIN